MLIVPSLRGIPIEEYSIRVVEDWKLGTAEADDGVLLLVAVEDRAWRIEVGGGLEGRLTDLQASRIGRGILAPTFREGAYAQGIAATLQAIAGALGGELSFEGVQFTQAPARGKRRVGVGGIIFMMILLMLLLGGRGGPRR